MNLTIDSIQIKRGTKKSLSVRNPILKHGEPCFEISKKDKVSRLKVGDGKHSWNELNYVSEFPEEQFHILNEIIEAYNNLLLVKYPVDDDNKMYSISNKSLKPNVVFND